MFNYNNNNPYAQTASVQPVSAPTTTAQQLHQAAMEMQTASAALHQWQANAMATYPQEMIPRAIYGRTVVGCGAIGAIAGAVIAAPFYGVARAATDITCDIADLVGYLANKHAAKKAARQGYVPTPAQPVYPPYPAAQPTLPPSFMQRVNSDAFDDAVSIIEDDPFAWLMTISREDFFEAWDASDANERCNIISWIQTQIVAATGTFQQLVNLAVSKILLEINNHMRNGNAQQAVQPAEPADDLATAQQAQQQADQVHAAAVQNLQQQHDAAVQAAQQMQQTP